MGLLKIEVFLAGVVPIRFSPLPYRGCARGQHRPIYLSKMKLFLRHNKTDGGVNNMKSNVLQGSVLCPRSDIFLKQKGGIVGDAASLSGLMKETEKSIGDYCAHIKEVKKMNHFKPLLKGLSYKSSIMHSFSQAINFFKKGIGTSKRNIKKRYKYSILIHSYETMERYIGIINNFKNTVLKDVKRINQITVEHISNHFKNLIDRDVTEKTIKINASALLKLFFILGRKDLVDYIDENRLLWAQMAKPSGRTMPFSNPEKVIDCINLPPFKSAAIIQYKTGARVSDIKKVVDWITTNTSARHIYIHKSKGGRDRIIDYSDRMDDFSEVVRAAFVIKTHFDSNNTNWTEFNKKYTDEVIMEYIATQDLQKNDGDFHISP